MAMPLSTVQTADDPGERGFRTRAGRIGERAFRRAMRHSRRVRRLRVLIPVLIATLLAGIVLVRWLDPLRVLARLPASTKGLVISGTKIKMEAPRLSGYTSDSRWYELTAESAAQDIMKPNVIELNNVRAKLQTPDKSTIDITAIDGVFDRSNGMLTLDHEIKLSSDNGLHIRLDGAVINTATSEIVSSKPVEVKTQQVTIRADRIEVTGGGELVSFIGGVVVSLPASDPIAAQLQSSSRP